jgi:hypothetical protein
MQGHLIEDDFMDGQRLNPATDGRPDSRPDVREEAPGLGSLESDFDFCQAPRPHDGRVYLTLGCDMECSIYAHGHLNLLRGRRHLGLQSILSTLEPGHATRIALTLSHANLSVVHHALETGHSVRAKVEVEAASGAERQRYDVDVRLTWR